LDRETRGLISEKIDYAFEKQHLLKTIDWILEADDRVVSQEDFALGYFMGSLMNVAYDIAFHKKLSEKCDKKFKKELEKIYGKGKSYERLRERDRIIEEARAKGGRRIKAELTEEEIGDIRNMLIPMIVPFREKIRKEVVLR
jgi:hypothetical protein